MNQELLCKDNRPGNEGIVSVDGDIDLILQGLEQMFRDDPNVAGLTVLRNATHGQLEQVDIRDRTHKIIVQYKIKTL